MRIIDLKNGKEIEKIERPLCLALGNFDGVHAGHKLLADTVFERSREMGIACGVWTFEEHPMSVLSKKGILFLTDNCEKNEIFADCGIDYMIYEDFCSVKDLAPDKFVDSILIDRLDCRCAVCGFNFKFGKGGAGNASFLKEQMEKRGRSALIVSPVLCLGKTVSSTEIRSYIESGDMESVYEMLGRPYSADLTVEHGQELGRTIGIPTINQRFPKTKIRPMNGIYAVKCIVDGKEYIGVSNVGSRPTVNSDEGDVNCETHIIGFSGWLYGQKVKVEFFKRLRDEIKFDGVDSLKENVERDIKNASEYFEKTKKG